MQTQQRSALDVFNFHFVSWHFHSSINPLRPPIVCTYETHLTFCFITYLSLYASNSVKRCWKKQSFTFVIMLHKSNQSKLPKASNECLSHHSFFYIIYQNIGHFFLLLLSHISDLRWQRRRNRRFSEADQWKEAWPGALEVFGGDMNNILVPLPRLRNIRKYHTSSPLTPQRQGHTTHAYTYLCTHTYTLTFGEGPLGWGLVAGAPQPNDGCVNYVVCRSIKEKK